MTDGPKVSVITPAYKAERHLAECAASVRDQTYGNIEHVIVDDASPDGTWDVIERIAQQDPRVVPVRLAANVGPAAARNAGIEIASGDYLAFLDADDLWLTEKLERQVSFMRDKQVSIAFSWYERIDDGGQRTGRVVKAPSSVGRSELLKSNYIGCLTAIYDVSVIGQRKMPMIPVHQDWAYWLELTRDGTRAFCIPEVLALYRHGYTRTVSSNKLRTLRHKWHIYREVEGFGRLQSLYYLCHLFLTGLIKYRI